MHKFIRTFGLVAVLSLSVVGCTKTVYITEDPPPPQMETKPAAPGPSYTWVDGHWKWGGKRYVWVGGHWAKQQGGKTWVAGHWERGPRGHYWVPGHWR